MCERVSHKQVWPEKTKCREYFIFFEFLNINELIGRYWLETISQICLNETYSTARIFHCYSNPVSWFKNNDEYFFIVAHKIQEKISCSFYQIDSERNPVAITLSCSFSTLKSSHLSSGYRLVCLRNNEKSFNPVQYQEFLRECIIVFVKQDSFKEHLSPLVSSIFM